MIGRSGSTLCPCQPTRIDLRLVVFAALCGAVLFGGMAGPAGAQSCDVPPGLTAPPLTIGQWSMVSLPCDPGAGATVDSVWGDDIPGTYGVDWVVYERREAADGYEQLALNSTLGNDAGVLGFEPAQMVGYWIKAVSDDGGAWDGTWDVEGTVTDPSPICILFGAPVLGCFWDSTVAPVPAPGARFNLLGNPYPIDIPWGETGVIVGVFGDPDPYLTLQEAIDAGIIDGTAWKNWNGADYESFDSVTPGLAGCLESFGGFWARILDVVDTPAPGDPVLAIPSTAIGACMPSPATLVAMNARQRRAIEGLGRSEWYIRLIAEAPTEGLRDATNVLGQLQDSVAGLDSHDLEALDPFDEDHMGIIFRHPEWDNWTHDFNSDYRAVSKNRELWSFIVRSGDPDRDIVLSWQGDRRMGRSWLMDVKTGEVVKARRKGVLQTYSFNMDGDLEREFIWAVVP